MSNAEVPRRTTPDHQSHQSHQSRQPPHDEDNLERNPILGPVGEDRVSWQPVLPLDLSLHICLNVRVRELLKVREVAGSVVVTLPQSILDPIGLRLGDRVLVEAAPPRRIVITKQGATMQSTARLELEIDVLEKRRQALESDLAYKRRQQENDMPCDDGMSDPDVALLMLSGLARDRDRLKFEIAQKKIELYDLLGVPNNAEGARVVPPTSLTGAAAGTVVRGGDGTHAGRILYAAAALAGADSRKVFSRKAVREYLGLDNRAWQSGYTAIFQGMRDDHPGGAPQVGASYAGVFHRVDHGTYELSAKGRRLVETLVDDP